MSEPRHISRNPSGQHSPRLPAPTDAFAAAYLRLAGAYTLAPGPVAGLGGRRASYPAAEVALALPRLRHVRWSAPHATLPGDTAPAEVWEGLRWRWREGDRRLTIGFTVAAADATHGAAPAIWAGCPVAGDCDYADLLRLWLALALRFPATRLRAGDDGGGGRLYTPVEFIETVALPRLAPALADGADPDAVERAREAREAYAALLAEAHALATPRALPPQPLNALYRDAALFAVNKPAGLVTHPTYKHPDGTLTDAVFAWAEARGEPRPWLLHRLDRETSGVTLFTRTERARLAISRQFAAHAVQKRYLALTRWPEGLPAEGEITLPLARDPLDRRLVIATPDGQPARTRYRRLAQADYTGASYALVLAEPVTGRTHQIRAHLAAVGAPLLGDTAYLAHLPEGDPARALAPRVMLHAWRLTLAYPTPDTPWSVAAPPPTDLLATADTLGLGAALRAALAEGEGAGGTSVMAERR